MFKKTIKIRLHERTLMPVKHGNMWDLAARGKHVLIEGKATLVRLGVSMTLPKWYGARIYPRSSTYKNFGCILTNSVGVIEADYSLEWLVHYYVLTKKAEFAFIPSGFRIAQFEIYLLPDAPWYMKLMELFRSEFWFKEVDVITTTRKGFGSTD